MLQPVFGEQSVIKLQNHKVLVENVLPYGDVIYIF